MNSVSILFAIISFASYSSGQFTDINNKLLDVENTGDIPDIESRLSFIFPGTKWCGTGSVADNYDDLGVHVETDKCCRAHDNCDDYIAGGETKKGLTNDAFYTRLSCECDETFRQCLHNTNTTAGNAVGQVYFNTITTKCYREDYPIKGCAREEGLFFKKCVKYSLDTTAKKVLQWFDVPYY